MSNTNAAFATLVDANPVPTDGSEPMSAWSAAALLDQIDARSEIMQTEERTQSTAALAPNRRRRGWLVAAAAFVAILLAVGAVAVLAPEEPDVADISTTEVPPPEVSPTTTLRSASTTTVAPVAPAPTTTEAPASVSAEQRRVIESFVVAYNEGEVPEQTAFFSPGTLLWLGPTIDGPRRWDEIEDVHVGALAFYAAVNSNITISDCDLADSGRIFCSGEWTDDILRATQGPVLASVVVETSPDGRLAYLKLNPNGASMAAAYNQFTLWMRTEHPDVELPDDPGLDPELLQLWTQYSEEFLLASAATSSDE